MVGARGRSYRVVCRASRIAHHGIYGSASGFDRRSPEADKIWGLIRLIRGYIALMATNGDFKHNHYVPEWYQKRFMLPGQGTYWYLDLKPEQMERNGHKFKRRALLPWGPVSCFAEDDLYTIKWGTEENVDIEKFFFGRVDSEGRSAVEFFSDFQFDDSRQEPAFQGLMHYMSVQKLRTPKGLGWLSGLPAGSDHSQRLLLLQQIPCIARPGPSVSG